MAENDTPQSDRTERPTPKRLDDARRRGQVPRSRELAMTLVMLASAGLFLIMSRPLGTGLAELVAGGLELPPATAFDPSALPRVLGESIGRALALIAPLLGVVVVAAIAGSLAFGGWAFNAAALAPKLERLSPLAGLKRVFGWAGLGELAKAVAKFIVVAAAATLLMTVLAPGIFGLGALQPDTGIARSAQLMVLCLVGLAAALVLIAAADVPFQLWQHRRRLKMTKQEIKEEQKDTEGKPEVRARIRSAQQAVANRRMMEDVPKADLVAMNPTHYAVALRYDAATMKAPKVVARGADLIALQIRSIAAAHNVPIFEHPPLAQALFHTSRVGQEVSPRLYVAVAQVLTYIYQLRGRAAVPGGGRPRRPDLAIDAELTLPAALRGPKQESAA